MPNRAAESSSCNVLADIARLQEQVKALEKTVETLEITLRAETAYKDLQTKEDLKGVKVTIGQLSKKLNSLELKIARYAGGAGVLTAIAIKLVDRIHF